MLLAKSWSLIWPLNIQLAWHRGQLLNKCIPVLKREAQQVHISDQWKHHIGTTSEVQNASQKHHFYVQNPT